MTRSLHLFWLRLAASLLMAMGLVVTGHAQAAMPFSGPLMAVEVCLDHETRMIFIDADGNEHPAPNDCRHCLPCTSPTADLSGHMQAVASCAIHQASSTVLADDHGGNPPEYRFPPARGPPPHKSRIASA